MEETSEELPSFSISIDLLGPDPTSKFPAVWLLQLHRARQRKHDFKQSKPLINSGL